MEKKLSFKDMDLCDKILFLLAPVLIIFVWFIVAFVVKGYFYHVVFIANIDHTKLEGISTTCVGLWLLFNIYYHHILAIFKSPGHVEQLNSLDKSLSLSLHALESEDKSLFCRKCSIHRPFRARHCKQCGTCVLRMDHHCPWLANCVGLQNLRNFIMFQLYLVLGCFYLIVLIVPSLVFPLESSEFRDHLEHATVVLVWAVAAFVAVSLHLCWQLFLISTNQTTIEFYTNKVLKVALTAALTNKGKVAELQSTAALNAYHLLMHVNM